MKNILVTELFGSMFSPDLEFKASNNQDAIKQYLAKKKWSAKALYDSHKNIHLPSDKTICIQEGHYEGEHKYIRGKRYFYKIVDN